jgi:hypothetical protein
MQEVVATCPHHHTSTIAHMHILKCTLQPHEVVKKLMHRSFAGQLMPRANRNILSSPGEVSEEEVAVQTVKYILPCLFT